MVANRLTTQYNTIQYTEYCSKPQPCTDMWPRRTLRGKLVAAANERYKMHSDGTARDNSSAGADPSATQNSPVSSGAQDFSPLQPFPDCSGAQDFLLLASFWD